jgi:hypothetical protein
LSTRYYDITRRQHDRRAKDPWMVHVSDPVQSHFCPIQVVHEGVSMRVGHLLASAPTKDEDFPNIVPVVLQNQ